MRKIINGRTYNTYTSKPIGEWWNGHNRNDFQYCCETLYKNTKGAYFLYGEGGALSRYAVSNGNNTSGGETITPMTKDEAMEWAEEHLEAEEYESEFGEQEEAGSDLKTRERVNLTLDNEIVANLRKLAQDTDGVMGRMVDRAIMAMYGDDFKRLEGRRYGCDTSNSPIRQSKATTANPSPEIPDRA